MSSWYNPASWQIFSDWGAARWSEDLLAAIEQAEAWTERTADARGWSEAQLLYAGNLIREAAKDQEDAIGFWRRLGQSWPEQALPGWAELGDTWDSAAGAARTTEAGREAGSVGEVAAGAAEGAGEDALDLISFGRTYGPWIVLVLVVLGVVVYASMKARA